MRFCCAALIALLVGCGGETGGSAAPPSDEDRPLAADFEEVYRIGGIAAEGWDAFTEIADLDFDAAGRLYIRDEAASSTRIVVVDGAGGLVADFGRRGDGPGELRDVGHMVARPGGGVVIVDKRSPRLSPVRPRRVVRARGPLRDRGCLRDRFRAGRARRPGGRNAVPDPKPGRAHQQRANVRPGRRSHDLPRVALRRGRGRRVAVRGRVAGAAGAGDHDGGGGSVGHVRRFRRRVHGVRARPRVRCPPGRGRGVFGFLRLRNQDPAGSRRSGPCRRAALSSPNPSRNGCGSVPGPG